MPDGARGETGIRMGLLDDLKKKADAAREALHEPAQAEERALKFRAVALPAMFRIHRGLSELVAQLKVLQEEAPASLRVAGLGDVGGLLQGQYDVMADATPPELITLRCQLRLAKPRPLELKTVGVSINAWIENARRQGVTMKVLRLIEGTGANQRAYVGLEGVIPVTLQFKLDVDANAIQFYTRNFDELSDRRQFFSPTAVTEAWCEEMLKFVLRTDNRFLKDEVSPNVREQLRRRIEWERMKEKGAEEVFDQRASTSNRLKNLFRRTPQLRLHYEERSWDLGATHGPFTLGRVADCDLQVKEQRVSRFHARIEFKDDQFHLVDDSTNGTNVRFEDGRSETLKHSSLALQGNGLIALGTEATPDNPHVIQFLM